MVVSRRHSPRRRQLIMLLQTPHRVALRLVERVDEFIFYRTTKQEQIEDLADVLAFWNLPYVRDRAEVREGPSLTPNQFFASAGWIYGLTERDAILARLRGGVRSPHKELELEPLTRQRSPKKIASAVHEQLTFVARHQGRAGRVVWFGEVLRSGLVPCVAVERQSVPRLTARKVARLVGEYPEQFAELNALLSKGKPDFERIAVWLLNQRGLPQLVQVTFFGYFFSALIGELEPMSSLPTLRTFAEQIRPEAPVDPKTLN